MTPATFVATLFTITTSLVAYLGYRDAPAVGRWLMLYVIAVVLPWMLFVERRRRGVPDWVAIEPLIVGQLTLQLSTGLVRHPDSGVLSGEWVSLLPLALAVFVFLVTCLVRHRIAR
jgi:hypothetical protein